MIKANRQAMIWGPQAAVAVLTLAVLTVIFSFVDLKPKVDKDFFFASDDPQFQQDKQISEIFPEPQQIIIGVKGDIKSADYIDRLGRFSLQLSQIPEVLSVQSMTQGPGSPANAFNSPLWRRILIPEDQKSSNVILFVEDLPPEKIVPQIESKLDQFSAEGFELMMTGPPYILWQIQHNLVRDLKVFSLSAFVIFGMLLFIFFRSFRILAGTLLACLNASAVTLLVTAVSGIEIGVLTANLSTIVFVLTLSHCIFITFNWKRLIEEDPNEEMPRGWAAARVTLPASFWSMLTTFLGFGSLIFVQATPLQKLGVSGAVGTFVAFTVSYLLYPWFLSVPYAGRQGGQLMNRIEKRVQPLLAGRSGWLVLGIFLSVLAAGTGLSGINTDPSLLSYFQAGSELREGLEYMDRNGGSSPLKIVLQDMEGSPFNTEEVYKRLWDLQTTLEQHDAVGDIISLPLVMAEGRERIPLSFFLTWEWLLTILEQPAASEIASYFVTPDRSKALFVLRMKESGRDYPRDAIVEQVRGITWAKGFSPALMGGVFLLQGKLAQLVTESLMWGLMLLITLFVAMGFFLSRSWRVTLALFASLCMIPAWMLGILGHFRIPLDIISAPATNIALGMGVDAMIHMLIFVKRTQGSVTDWNAWVKSRNALWKPVVSSMILICAGFGIFILSRFPPTQRFGLAVILGSMMAPVTALLVLPYLAAFKTRK